MDATELCLAHTSKQCWLQGWGTYPYRGTRQACPSGLSIAKYNRGAAVTGWKYTWNGNEALLEKTVAEHGAAMSTVAADGDFIGYGGDLYDGNCTSTPNHAITVVGYGTTDTGEKYWLIKNSW